MATRLPSEHLSLTHKSRHAGGKDYTRGRNKTKQPQELPTCSAASLFSSPPLIPGSPLLHPLLLSFLVLLLLSSPHSWFSSTLSSSPPLIPGSPPPSPPLIPGSPLLLSTLSSSSS